MTAPTRDLATISQSPQTTERPIDRVDLELLFIHLLQFPQFFTEARRLVQPYLFTPGVESDFQVLWMAMCTAFDQYRCFRFHPLVGVINDLTTGGALSITAEQLHELVRQDDRGLLYSALDESPENLHVQFAESVLQKFLRERLVIFPMRRLMLQGQNHYPDQMFTFLEAARTQQQQIDTLGRSAYVEVMLAPGQRLPPPPVHRNTGVDWIDDMIGGQVDGDVNGLLGITGGFKTTSGLHVATTAAKQYFIDAADGETPGLSVYVTYEQPLSRLRGRIMSAAAQIPSDKTESMLDTSVLSTPASLEDYERRLAPSNDAPLSEIERYEAARQWMSKCFRLVDYSGQGENGVDPAKGVGYLDELSSELYRLSDNAGAPIKSVFIDWLGAMILRDANFGRTLADDMRSRLTWFSKICGQKIAGPFGCAVWVIHQMRAEAGACSPTRLMLHTDAMESKAFATNLANCACLGVVCKQTGCLRLNWSKTRYKKPEDVRPTILRRDDTFALMRDVSERFVISDDGNKFVDKDTYNEAQGQVSSNSVQRVNTGPHNVGRVAANIERLINSD